MAEIDLIYKRAIPGGGREVTEEEFIRNAYIELYAADDTEENIDEIQLSPVEVRDAQILSTVCHYDATLTAEVGYNVQEQYVDKENVRIDGRTYTKDVIKTRTVTKWQPFSTNVSDVKYAEDVKIVQGGKGKVYIPFFRDSHLYSPNPVEFVDIDASEKEAFPPITNQEIIQMANEYADKGKPFKKSEETLIHGDKHRNFSALWSLKKVDAVAFLVKEYAAQFTYRGEKSYVSQRVLQDYISTTYPRDVEDEELSSAKANKEEALKNDPKIEELKAKQKKNKKTQLIVLIISALLLILLPPVAIVGFALCLFYFTNVDKKINSQINERTTELKNYYDNLTANRAAQIQSKKIELLNARFAKMGFAPLTEDEIARFEV